MRKTIKIIALVALMLACFIAGLFTAAVLHIGSPIVTVDLKNASTKQIASLRLVHEHGIVELINLAANSVHTVRFYSPAESSYKISLVFADGHSLEDVGNYVEPGYSVTEIITEDGIKTEFDLFAYRP